jgi:hypothetical protein
MPVSAALILAQVAQIVEGQLLIAGGGWTVRAPEPESPIAVAGVLTVPRDQIGHEYHARIELLDPTGERVLVERGEGASPIVVEWEFSVSGLTNANLTSPISAPFALNFGAFPLPPGREYLWRFHIDGETRDEWTLAFRTTPPEAPSREDRP